VGSGKDFHASMGGFGTLCRWNWGVWVAGRTFMPSGVHLEHCVGGMGGMGGGKDFNAIWGGFGTLWGPP
jgi:hypothetical protein